jgi:hypothetical protein
MDAARRSAPVALPMLVPGNAFGTAIHSHARRKLFQIFARCFWQAQTARILNGCMFRPATHPPIDEDP